MKEGMNNRRLRRLRFGTIHVALAVDNDVGAQRAGRVVVGNGERASYGRLIVGEDVARQRRVFVGGDAVVIGDGHSVVARDRYGHGGR